MGTQHTPGPWKLLQAVRELKQPHNEASHYDAVVIRAGVGPPWGHVCRLDFGYGTVTDSANAHLITAAPDLLDLAATTLAEWHAKDSNFDREEPGRIKAIRASQFYEIIRQAAIAKAEAP